MVMKVIIAAVGRMKNGPERSLMESYLTRIPWPLEIHEIDNKGKGDPTRRTQNEAEKLTAAIPKGAKTICLESRGHALTSEEIAQRIDEWRNDGIPSLVFLIGGPDGLTQQTLDSADLILSFGSATWPHMLTRVMLVEQLYRAHCILTGHPYHCGH
jgi:23S rRNA (pseudouridine1915-N3)-methyltransferase